MRRLLVALGLVAGSLLLRARRCHAAREYVALHYDDGSAVTLERGAAGTDRLLQLARSAP